MLLIRDPQWCLDHPDVLPYIFAAVDEHEIRGNGGDIYVGDKFVASLRIDPFGPGLAEWWCNNDGTVAFTQPWFWLEELDGVRRVLEIAADLGPHTPQQLITLLDINRALAEAYERDDRRPPPERYQGMGLGL